MDMQSKWAEIRKHFNKSFSTNFHVSIASVDRDNNPTNTPIGSLFLNSNQTGFYFEKFPTKLAEINTGNTNVCVLGVDSSVWFWLTALISGRFKRSPALKLYGQLGIKRKATEVELKRLKRRMRMTRWLKGNALLWGNMEYVREITFIRVEKINLGKMTNHL